MRYVMDDLAQTALQYPTKAAFIDENRELTFSRLQEESMKLGTSIAAFGYFQKPICIFMEKRVECITSMMGILSSGNFYTVLDIQMPESRIRKILEVLEPVMIVTNASCEEQVRALSDTPVLLYEDAMRTDPDQQLLDTCQERLDGESTMFVLFTSGSTGIPKGVIIKHKAFPPYLAWYREYFSFDETTVFANQAPFYFIMSCPEIFLTIQTGATCYIVPKKAFSFPMVTLNYLKERHVNTLYWVPSALCLIANFRALPEVHLDDLRTVMFGGEVMPTKQLNMWRREYPDVRFVNLYGPTETTEMISYFEVDRDIDDAQSLPIGISVPYLKTFLLDEAGREVTDDGIGELCSAGISVAGGYYRMPEKTAEVFCPNPLYRDGDDPEMKRMYRTGDLARWDDHGDLIYMGRKDFQIKHMGNRIELGEIETAVSALDGIDRNCCLYDTGRNKIVLFYTGTLDEDSIDAQLRSYLPEYMIPNRIEKLKMMPFNVNGKIDRAGLKELI